MFHFLSPAVAALLQVVLIDIVLAGDNALVIGMVAARVPKANRHRVIFWGLVVAVVSRVAIAIATLFLLDVAFFLVFAGGVLLLWVSWRLYREIRQSEREANAFRQINPKRTDDDNDDDPQAPVDNRRVIVDVALADLSMSLDNVLAVTGVAISLDSVQAIWVLGLGLLLSIALMGVAAAMIAGLLQRHPWISYAGLIVVLYVALRMIFVGGREIYHPQHASLPALPAIGHVATVTG